MASNRIVRELFRSLETTLQERLAMIEDVLRLGNIRSVDEEDAQAQDSVLEKLAQLEGMVSSLAARLDAMELSKRDPHSSVPIETVHVNHIGKEAILEQDVKGLEVRVKPECSITAPLRASAALPTVVIAQPIVAPNAATTIVSSNESIEIENEVAISDEEVVEEVAEEEVVEEVVEEEAEEEVVEEVVEEEAEEEVVEEVVEEEAEEEVVEEVVEEDEEAAEDEEAIELKEFTFKGKTYYMDSEQQVYGVDAEGELIEQPIGTWDEARQRVLFRRATS